MKDDQSGKRAKKPSVATKKVAPAKIPGLNPEPAIARMKRKDYEASLEELHVELVKLQEWVVHKKLKVCIFFEGRDTAG